MGKESKVITFAGEIGSGKDTAVDVYENISRKLKPEIKIGRFRFSSLLIERLDQLRIPHSRENMAHVSRELIAQNGSDILTRILIERIQFSPQIDLALISGMRRIAEAEAILSLPDSNIVYIEADPFVRYKRIIARGEKVDESQLTFEQFLKEGQDENEREIPKIKQMAQFVIYNNGTYEELVIEIGSRLALNS